MGDHKGSQAWLMLAVGSLVLAGTLSLVLVVGRLPVVGQWINDPLFARRCLVIHVNLALAVWLYSGLGALFLSMPGKRRGGQISAWLGVLGVGLFVSVAGIMGVKPVLSNYIPALDHPVFLVGLLIFGVAVLCTFVGVESWRESGDVEEGGLLPWPTASRVGLRAAAIAFVLAMFTFLGSWWTTPSDLPAEAYYELVFWGGGHVLQVASVAMMVAIWIMLLYRITGKHVISVGWAKLGFALLLAPLFLAPWWAFSGTTTGSYYPRFTILMRWGIFPVVSVMIVWSLWFLVRSYRAGHWAKDATTTPYLWGFVASVSLTVLGFVLGAMIRGSSTLIPAHYHAAIGAVTVSLMTVTYLLCLEFRWDWSDHKLGRWAKWQPVLFGVGQVVFAVGFGSARMARKIYGHEQHIRSWSEQLGMLFMGLGGLVAVVGGLLFLSLVFVAWRRRKPVVPSLLSWEKNNEFKENDEKQRATEGIGGAGTFPIGESGLRGGSSFAKAHGQSLAPPAVGGADSNPVLHRMGLD